VRSLGGSNVTLMRKVRLRACLPELFSGLRIAVPMALLGAVASEWLGGVDRGLGIFMVNALGTLQPARVWAICVMCVVLTLTGYAIVAAVERRVNRWTGEVRAGTGR
jgi:ABC-type nitrate/sulfonate/bicarbonate transport system permease component